MSKTPANTADAQPESTAAIAPDAAAAEAEADRLWREMASKHSDPYGKGVGARPEFADDPGDDEPKLNEDKPAGSEGQVEGVAQPELKPEPAKASAADDQTKPEKQPAAKTGASKDAPAADDIWAKADKNPKTAALKKAWDLAPAEARPAIEAAQRDLLERGKEIHRLRSRPTASPAAAAPAPAPKTEEAPKFDLSKNAKWQKAKEDYPDALGPVEDLINDMLGSVRAEVRQEIEPLKQVAQSVAEDRTAAVLGEESRRLHEMHPNYSEIVKSDGFSDAFASWVASQPETVKAMVANNSEYVKDADEASIVFERFQKQTGFGVEAAKEPEPKTPAPAPRASTPQPDPAKQARRRSQLQGSDVVEGRGQSAVTGDPNDADYWWDFHNKRKSEQLAAERNVH